MTSTSVDFKYIGLTDYASVLYNITQHDPKQLFIESIHYDNIFVNLSSRLGTNKLSVNDGGGVIDLSLRTTGTNGDRLIDSITYINEINTKLIAAYGTEAPIITQLSGNSFTISNPSVTATYVFSASNPNSLILFHSDNSDLTLLPSTLQDIDIDIFLGVNSIKLLSNLGQVMILPQQSISNTSLSIYLPNKILYNNNNAQLRLNVFYSSINISVNLFAKDKVITLTVSSTI